LPVSGSSGDPGPIVTDPQGKFLYVSNFGAIDGFAIDGTGSLTALPSSPFLGYYGDITISHNGRFLFATDLGPTPTGFGGGISAFTIDPGTGTLTLVAGSPFIVPVGDPLSAANPVSLVVDPGSNFVYTVVQWLQHGGQGELTFVYGLSIDAATGALIAISNPPIFQPGNNLSSYAIAVSGSLLYVSNDQGVIAFSITPVTGVLTQVNRSPFPPGTASGGIVISPDGKFLYQAVNTYGNGFGIFDTANMIDFFSLDLGTGAATSVGSVTTPTGPLILSISKQ
jgi:6-phosphogluconolactonase